jgi:sucrose-6-phosphate hydrolase SacC (GH32 family)
VYVIMHASSSDGVHWARDAQPVIPARVDFECQTSASTFAWQGRQRMLFSYRHGVDFRNSERGYRIGHAVSDDLLHWQRNDDAAGIAPSAAGWDSQMICYPHVFDLDGRTLMLYCGNEFGREGFGWAQLLA